MASNGTPTASNLKIFDDHENDQNATGSERRGGRARSGRGYFRDQRNRLSNEVRNDDKDNHSESNSGYQSGRSSGNTGRGRGRGSRLNKSSSRIPAGNREQDPTGGPDVVATFPATEDDGVKKEVRPMGWKKLKDLSSTGSDPDKSLLDISHLNSGFKQLLEPSLFQRNVRDIMRLLAHVSSSTNVNILRNLFESLLSDPLFSSNLCEVMNNIALKEHSCRVIWSSKDYLKLFCKNISEFLKVMMSTLPSSLNKCLTIIKALEYMCSEHELNEVFVEVNTVFTRVRQEKENAYQSKHLKKRHGTVENTEPPENFRDISIYPTLQDLHLTDAPFLRANKTRGKYESLDTYLDIQFRLLREDYVRPLREGISEYRKCIAEGVSTEKSRNIRIYKFVQILRPVCTGNGINYILQFDTSKLKKINWSASRRLLFGSLVCLSCDGFESVHYAVVSERDTKQLTDGMIGVHFESMAKELFDTQRNERFVMAETTAYFEACRYVLEGLQETQEPLPLSPYILSCEKSIKAPAYISELGQQPSFDFSCIYPKNKYMQKISSST